ncbi:hypothetical protein ACP4OV_005910 [Aristida adscensionis]
MPVNSFRSHVKFYLYCGCRVSRGPHVSGTPVDVDLCLLVSSLHLPRFLLFHFLSPFASSLPLGRCRASSPLLPRLFFSADAGAVRRMSSRKRRGLVDMQNRDEVTGRWLLGKKPAAAGKKPVAAGASFSTSNTRAASPRLQGGNGGSFTMVSSSYSSTTVPSPSMQKKGKEKGKSAAAAAEKGKAAAAAGKGKAAGVVGKGKAAAAAEKGKAAAAAGKGKAAAAEKAHMSFWDLHNVVAASQVKIAALEEELAMEKHGRRNSIVH